jgi:Mg2+/Co2+ transporter CorB
MDFGALGLLIALVVLIFVSAFFSSSETGMMSLNRYRVKHKARAGSRTAQKVLSLLKRPDRLLGVILIGNTFANILASALATVIAVRVFGEAGILIATILLTIVILIFAEVTPKTFAAVYPERLAFIVVWPLALLLRLLYPIVWLANLIANGVLWIFRVDVKGSKGSEILNKEELRTVVDEALPENEKNSQEGRRKDMLLSVLDLERISVEDVMLPRNEIVGVDLNDSMEKIVKQLTASEHTRLPLYYGSIEKVVGIFHLRDALRLLDKNKLTKKTIIKCCIEPYFIPEGTALTTQLQKFRERERRMALVVDEYGDIMGLVSVEDILEEIVGELDSSMGSIPKMIMKQADGSFLVNASVSVRELNKFMNWKLPEDGPKTLSGLIVERLETIPKSQVGLVIAGYRIEVVQIKGNIILKARVVLV